MKAVTFPEVNETVEDKPVRIENMVIDKVPHRWQVSCWKLSWWERLVLLFTGEIWALHTDKITELTCRKEDVL